jgi:ABC-type sugar transport system ATPase subunit
MSPCRYEIGYENLYRKTIQSSRQGNIVFLTVEVEGASLKARLSPECALDRGEPVSLRLNEGRIHLFSAKDGVSLLRSA